MVEKVSSTDAYIKQRFSQLPQAERGEAHVIKSGESLWNIAKAEVGKTKKKAKNSEINDYMLLLAKLNGLDTEEKMNKIKTNSTIYLPGKEKKNGGISPQTARTTTQQPARTTSPQAAKTTTQQRTSTTANPQQARRTTQQATPTPVKKTSTAAVTTQNKTRQAAKPQQTLTSSEQSFADRTKTLYNDPNARIEKSYSMNFDGDQLYAIYSVNKRQNGSINPSSTVMMVGLNKYNKLNYVSFNDNIEINKGRFDYTIRKNKNGTGRVTAPQIAEIGDEPTIGTISAAELDKLEEWVNKNKKE